MSVTVKDVQVKGELTPAAVQKALEDELAKLTQCCQDAAKAGVKLPAELTLTFTIGLDGKIVGTPKVTLTAPQPEPGKLPGRGPEGDPVSAAPEGRRPGDRNPEPDREIRRLPINPQAPGTNKFPGPGGFLYETAFIPTIVSFRAPRSMKMGTVALSGDMWDSRPRLSLGRRGRLPDTFI